MSRPARRGVFSSAALLVASVATIGALLAIRPTLAGSPSSWSGDDLAFAGTWLVAVACAVWLALTTVLCLAALASGRRAHAARIASWAPPFARRILQIALVSTWAVVPTAAHAAPAGPLVLHVGPGGRLASVPGSGTAGSVSPDDAPVVRAPPAATTSTTPTLAPPSPASTPITSPPITSPPIAPATRLPPTTPGPARGHRAAVAAASPAAPGTHVVRAGDNMWRIARAEVGRATANADPGDSEVARYWEHMIAANRATLRSGNPSLIFPGEIVSLPAVDRD